MAGLNVFNTESLKLVTMVVVDRTKTYLNQPIGKLLFHDPRKWRGMGTRVVLVVVIDVWMGIDVKDRELWVTLSNRTHDRVRDGMITA